MKEIGFVDCTIRDGPQSLWANRMTAAEMLSIAPTIDRAGYKRVEGPNLNAFIVYLRFLRENPWEKIRLLVKAMPNTTVQGSMRTTGCWGFNIQPDSLIDLYVGRCIAYGYKSFLIFDALHDFSKSAKIRKILKSEGCKVELALVYSLSPVHTDKYYARLAAELAQMDDVDIVRLKDSIGLLTPDRVRTLVPIIRKNLGGKPLEIHSHCTTGLAPLCYLEAIKLGVETVQTSISPLANGNSNPSTENIIKNIRLLGYTSTLDDKVLETIAAHFRYVAKREGKPIGRPFEYDLSLYEHQIPGGMRSNLESQLELRGELNRLEEVLEEVALIRKEMGYPVMITPLSQIMGTQAALNVITGERYKVIIEELYQYALGFFGKIPVPIEQNIMDKIFSTPRGKEYLKWEPPQPSIAEIRKQVGGQLSDDELLLQLMLPEENIKNFLATVPPLKTDYPSPALEKPVMVLVRDLARRANLAYINVQKKDFSLTMQKKG
jgi:oxaloacetate decarboxylase alpha subunit